MICAEEDEVGDIGVGLETALTAFAGLVICIADPVTGLEA
jgi:hypothetical protein